MQPSDLPVVITFMGQFIAHDLTKNATNLVDPELDQTVEVASPLIDLDSVYGPRSDAAPSVPPVKTDGRCELRKLDNTNNAYDVPRASDGTAMLPDGRNDENQLILQIHWQSVVLNDHQASVLDPAVHDQVLKDLKAELSNPGHGPVKYRPTGVEQGLFRMRAGRPGAPNCTRGASR
jgi:hypothetical protein